MRFILVLISLLPMLPNAFAQCERSSLQTLGVMARETGLETLDKALQKYTRQLEPSLSVDLDVYLFNDENRPELVIAPSNHYTAKAAIGNRLMTRYLTALPEGDQPLAVAVLLGHLSGHALLMEKGHYLPAQQKELLADYFAGYFLGRSTSLSHSELVLFCNRFFHLAQVGFWDVRRQGTPTQRYTAFMLGVEDHRLPPQKAYQRGRALVPDL